MIDPLNGAGLVLQAIDIAAKIISAAEAARYNKSTCESLARRVRAANSSIEGLRNRQQQAQEWFSKQTYKDAFEIYVIVLGQIKNFVSLVSTQSGLARFRRANSTRAEFERLRDELDSATQALCLGVVVSTYEQQLEDREQYQEDQKLLPAELKDQPTGQEALLQSARNELIFSSPPDIRQAELQAEVDLAIKHKQFAEKAPTVLQSARDELLFSGPDSFGAVAVGERLFKEKKYAEAWDVFCREANTSPRALYWLGYFTYFGPRYGQKPDKALAQLQFQEAATAGDADAADMLGVCYKDAKNYPEAVKWFQKAADHGHLHGSYHLGMMYLVDSRAPGGKADMEKAKFYLKRAAAQGHEDAKKQLMKNGLDE
ncbi:hypothetical protein HK104_003916 [Borealophlyctis nickersoniae]|nr:hypothetical protein HK104_003916 [Borealophlyctis nickersoniae]